MSDLDLGEYYLAWVKIVGLSSVVTEFHLDEVAAIIAVERESEIPLVVITGRGQFLYSGLETVMARLLLCGDEFVGKVIYR